MRVFIPVQWISLGALCALILIGVFTLPRLTILILLGLANLLCNQCNISVCTKLFRSKTRHK